MSNATVLFLPPDADLLPRWWRLADGARVAAGDGWPLLDAEEPLLAVAPAQAVTLHWGELPDRSPAQTLAAARVLADEAIATGAPTHVAVAAAPDAEGMRAIAVTAPEAMTAWSAALQRDGLGEPPLVPAALLLPEGEGYRRAALPFGDVVRGPGSGFADEPALTELVVGGEEVAQVDAAVFDAALSRAVAAPPLDLRQGAFARVRRRAIDWALVRRLAILAGCVLLATLAIDLVRIVRYNFGAGALEAQADASARRGLPRGAGEGDAARMLDARLARLRGPGLGFSRSAAAVYDIIRQVNGAEVTGLDFQPSGALKISLTVPGESEANGVKSRLEAAGFTVNASVFNAANGRLAGDMTVTP